MLDLIFNRHWDTEFQIPVKQLIKYSHPNLAFTCKPHICWKEHNDLNPKTQIPNNLQASKQSIATMSSRKHTALLNPQPRNKSNTSASRSEKLAFPFLQPVAADTFRIEPTKACTGLSPHFPANANSGSLLGHPSPCTPRRLKGDEGGSKAKAKQRSRGAETQARQCSARE